VKKNVIGHMMAERETFAAKLRRSRIIPKLICLLLALLIWLAVVNSEREIDHMADSRSADTEWVA
jgi:YbbR domain-containing protein